MKNVLLKKTLPLLLVAPLFARNAHAFTSTVMITECIQQTKSSSAKGFFDACSIKNIKAFVKKHPGMYALTAFDLSLYGVYTQYNLTSAITMAAVTVVGGGIVAMDLNSYAEMLPAMDQLMKDINLFKSTGDTPPTLEAATEVTKEKNPQLTTAESVALIEKNIGVMMSQISTMQSDIKKLQEENLLNSKKLAEQQASSSGNSESIKAMEKQLKDQNDALQNITNTVNSLSAMIVKLSLSNGSLK